MSCVFCKIINGEIPGTKIYEDEDCIAIMDISQATLGHTLVIPKKHYENILTIEDYEYLRVMQVAKDLAPSIVKALGATGCNILNNCNESAGQTVMHFHVHIIPRYENDDVKIEFTEHEYDIKAIQEKILKEINK